MSLSITASGVAIQQLVYLRVTAKQILCELFEMSVEIKRELGVFSITMLKTNWHPKCQQRDLQVHQRE